MQKVEGSNPFSRLFSRMPCSWAGKPSSLESARSREAIQSSVRSSFTSHMSTDARVPGVSEGSIALNT
jgi:hypothetical protein